MFPTNGLKENAMKRISALLLLGVISSAQAATIAVIDSGLDYKHEFITPNLWTNPNEIYDLRDNDGNGYQDDVNGWNFAEQSGQIIDYKYLGTFSPDCTKYFDVQGKYLLKQATADEIAWMRAKVADPAFIKEMGKFGNFVHGTHVAGISIKGTHNEVMGIKLIPTEVKLIFEGMAKEKALDRWSILQKAFDALATQQMNLLGDIARFAASHHADVANGSFGTGFKQAKMITDNAYKIIFFKAPSAEDSDKATTMFMNALLTAGKTFVASAPDMLFVFAAGNDGSNNDKFGSSPANIRADNVISVGATYKNEFFAPFSNYGTEMVEVAAPGMLIRSSIPGGEYLAVSGTSQASPYVANVAGQIKAANPTLKPVEIKKILMGTVDKKAFLTDKIASGGIVNPDRARVAGEMSKSVSVDEAISRSRTQVRDMEVQKTEASVNLNVTPIPLTPMFQ
jgi:subtilisin family serine protease